MKTYIITKLRPIKLNTQMKKRYRMQVVILFDLNRNFIVFWILVLDHITLHFCCARLLNVLGTFQFHKAILLYYSM